MPNPTLSDVHVSTPLTNMSVAYSQSAGGVKGVARRVFPIVPVNKQSNSYFTYTKADLLRRQAKKRAPGAKAARGTMALTTATYSCERYAIARELPDPVRANYDSPLNAEKAQVQFIMDQLMMEEDAVFATNYFGTGLWGVEYDGANAADSDSFVYWSTSGSTPIDDVLTVRREIKNSCGLLPNVMVVSGEVDDVLKKHAQLLARVNGGSTTGQPGLISDQLIAQLFGVDEYIVGETIQNTAQEGATASLSSIFGKHAMLAFRANAPAIDVPSAGYCFSWTDFDGAKGGAKMKTYREEAIESDVYEGEVYFDLKLVASDAGGFFKDIVE